MRARWRRLLRLLSILLAVYVAGCAVLAWLVLYPPSPDPGSIEGFAEVSISGEVELAASYRAGKGPAVLLLHGYKENRTFMAPLARKLAAATDWTLLAPDLRGCGRSGDAPSTSGIAEVADVEAALDFLEQRGHAPESIAVAGFSMGAVAALRASARRRLGGLVLFSPYRDLRDAYDARTRHFAKLPVEAFYPTLWFVRWFAGEDLFAVDLLAEARASRARHRLVLSERDDWRAPLPDARAIAGALDARLAVFPGTEHKLRANPKAHAECIAVLSRWLAPGSPPTGGATSRNR